MSANVETMFYVRETPWHSMGVSVQTAPTAVEAMKLAGLDWEVKKVPVLYKNQPTTKCFTVRTSDDTVLGVVGKKYSVIQNRRAFEFCDEILGKNVTYETAGSLYKGRRIWMLARMERQMVLGDEVDPYLCLTNTYDGSGSFRVFMTPVRVVCSNTLNMALDKAVRSWSFPHIGNVMKKTREAAFYLGLSNNYMREFSAEAELLATKKITNNRLMKFISQLLPINEDSQEFFKQRQEQKREMLLKAWNIDDLGNIRGTAWGFLNAVSDMSTHYWSKNVSQDSRFTRSVLAPVMLDKAYAMVKEIV